MRKHQRMQWADGAIRVQFIDPMELDEECRDGRNWQYACDICGDIGYERTKGEAVAIADEHRQKCNGETLKRKQPAERIPMEVRLHFLREQEEFERRKARDWAVSEVQKPGVLHAVYGYVWPGGEVICRESFSDEEKFRAREARLWDLGCTTILATHAEGAKVDAVI